MIVFYLFQITKGQGYFLNNSYQVQQVMWLQTEKQNKKLEISRLEPTRKAANLGRAFLPACCVSPDGCAPRKARQMQSPSLPVGQLSSKIRKLPANTYNIAASKHEV